MADEPLARILNCQRTGDNEDFPKAVFLARGQNHAANAWIERQFGELAANFCKLMPRIHRAQFAQQLVAIGNQARAWRFKEWKFADIAQP